MSHPPTAVSLTPVPHPLILAAVSPKLDTEAFPLPCLFIPLSLVCLAFPYIFEFIYINSYCLNDIFFLLTMKAPNSTTDRNVNGSLFIYYYTLIFLVFYFGRHSPVM